MLRKTELIQCLATKGEKKEIKQGARRAGLTVSTFVRQAALKEARSERTAAIVTSPDCPKSGASTSNGSSAHNEARLNVVGEAGPSSSTLEDSHES